MVSQIKFVHCLVGALCIVVRHPWKGNLYITHLTFSPIIIICEIKKLIDADHEYFCDFTRTTNSKWRSCVVEKAELSKRKIIISHIYNF